MNYIDPVETTQNITSKFNNKSVIKKYNLIPITLNMSGIIITILSQYPTNFYFIMYKKKTDKQCTVVLSHTNKIYKTINACT